MKITLLTKEQEDSLYGDRKISIGSTFKIDDHYYLQRKDDVLHINITGTISSLHVGYLNAKQDGLIPIKYIEFETEIRKLIYNLEINQYWKVS